MKFISEPAVKKHCTKTFHLSDYCVNDISPGTLADFRLKVFTQEEISSYGDPCP